MKLFATFLLLLVIMIPLAETAHAKDEIITYDEEHSYVKAILRIAEANTNDTE